MKKLLVLCLVLVLAVAAFAGCKSNTADEKAIIAAVNEAVEKSSGKSVDADNMNYEVGKTMNEYATEWVETPPVESEDILFVTALIKGEPKTASDVIDYAASYNTETKEVTVLAVN